MSDVHADTLPRGEVHALDTEFGRFPGPVEAGGLLDRHQTLKERPVIDRVRNPSDQVNSCLKRWVWRNCAEEVSADPVGEASRACVLAGLVVVPAVRAQVANLENGLFRTSDIPPLEEGMIRSLMAEVPADCPVGRACL